VEKGQGGEEAPPPPEVPGQGSFAPLEELQL